jgi:hypothetical protein
MRLFVVRVRAGVHAPADLPLAKRDRAADRLRPDAASINE